MGLSIWRDSSSMEFMDQIKSSYGYTMFVPKVDGFRELWGFSIYFTHLIDPPITPRAMRDYPESLKALSFTLDARVMELGAGLGGFVPYLVDNFEFEERPVVVDIANYGILREMLKFAKREKFTFDVGEEIDSCLYVCDVILDSKKIDFVNSSLLSVEKRRSDLVGKMDCIVDNYGVACDEISRNSGKSVSGIVNNLLAWDGVYLCEDCTKTFVKDSI